jgi:hypothetical protein
MWHLTYNIMATWRTPCNTPARSATRGRGGLIDVVRLPPALSLAQAGGVARARVKTKHNMTPFRMHDNATCD